MGSSSRVSRAAFYAVLVLLVVAGASYLINSRVGGIQIYDVYPTNSMYPTLAVGDLVVVHSVPFSSIQRGDVIVFAKPSPSDVCTNVMIVHRVFNITQAGLITWGDNRFTNGQPDEPGSWPPVPSYCVKGVVAFAIPYLGEVSEAFPPPLNYILVVIIIIVIFLVELVSARTKPAKIEDQNQGRQAVTVDYDQRQ